MRFAKRYLVLFFALAVVGIFWWARFNNISRSLMFFNDMGRDMLVLQQWKMSGKPPLLGPQTSALPINQSALYFYLLYPIFILTNGHPASELITCSLVYVLLLILGLFVYKNNKRMQFTLVAVLFLAAIHPQYIIQGRFVWNPSFVSPFIVMAVLGYYEFIKKQSRTAILFLAIGLAMAVSLSYSVAPVVIAVLIHLVYTSRKKAVLPILVFGIFLVILNFPTILFELRHHFQLTGMLFNRGASVQKAADITMLAKLSSFVGYGISTGIKWLDWAFLLILVWLCITDIRRGGIGRLAGGLLLLMLVVNLVVPLTIHSHYIFGFTTLMFLLLVTGRHWIPLAILVLPYSLRVLSGQYFVDAPRTYQQINSCIQTVCNQVREPIFESVQAGYHPYHNGPEFRYLMLKNGCNLKIIEDNPNDAKLMAVVLDQSSFENGKTKFNELSMFGDAKEIQRYKCQENFEVVIIEKVKPSLLSK